VYLDENDDKVILVRQTENVMKLQDCGIPLEKRFAFYDQVILILILILILNFLLRN
jgi:hypothetical protein